MRRPQELRADSPMPAEPRGLAVPRLLAARHGRATQISTAASLCCTYSLLFDLQILLIRTLVLTTNYNYRTVTVKPPNHLSTLVYFTGRVHSDG